MTREKSLSDRLKEGLEMRQMKQVDLVKETGINKGAISSYISGKYEPKKENIAKIARALDISEEWLLGYDVSPERTDKDVADYLIHQMCNPKAFGITPTTTMEIYEEGIEEKYDRLDEHGKKMVDLVLDEELRRLGENDTTEEPRMIPTTHFL